MNVQEIMTRQLLWTAPSTSVWDALQTMEEASIHELPVVDDDQLVGIVTQRDLERMLGPRARQPPPTNMPDVRSRPTVRQGMSSPAISVTEQTPLAQACQILADARIGSLPVVGEDGGLVGLLSVTDVLRYMARSLRETRG
ncbi:MAG TPA: CBS domain-containing protein [Deltaproteobacteria bacterium]|nr:CBS domain-containing protein [Deltaproteobacteria bacterium]